MWEIQNFWNTRTFIKSYRSVPGWWIDYDTIYNTVVSLDKKKRLQRTSAQLCMENWLRHWRTILRVLNYYLKMSDCYSLKACKIVMLKSSYQCLKRSIAHRSRFILSLLLADLCFGCAMFGDIDSEHKMATDSNDQQPCRLIRKKQERRQYQKGWNKYVRLVLLLYWSKLPTQHGFWGTPLCF